MERMRQTKTFRVHVETLRILKPKDEVIVPAYKQVVEV